MTDVSMITLNDGVLIPQLGLGTWKLRGDPGREAIGWALNAGYRHIDTASRYENEDAVGQAIAASGLARDELFVTSKVWPDALEPAAARASIERSLEELQLDHVDLFLIHWPATARFGDLFVRTWDALQQFKADGLTRCIGVSNMHAHHLDKLSGELPAVDQVELHPLFNQAQLRAELASRGINVEAYSPLGKTTALVNDAINQIAESIGRSPAQVVLRWHIQHGIIAIPRSSTRSRIVDNLNVFDFELTGEQMTVLDGLSSPEGRTGADPDTF